jgi:hypothetical protein
MSVWIICAVVAIASIPLVVIGFTLENREP